MYVKKYHEIKYMSKYVNNFFCQFLFSIIFPRYHSGYADLTSTIRKLYSDQSKNVNKK